MGAVLTSWDTATARMDLIKSYRGKGGFRCKKFSSAEDARFYTEFGTAPTRNTPPPPNTVIVYTDGSSFDLDGARVAGYGIFFGDGHPDNTGEPLRNGKPTNNRAELYAIHRALEIVKERAGGEDVVVYSDSTYSRKCLFDWRCGWEASNFKDDTIKNRDMIEATWALLDTYPRKVKIEWVKGHSGVHGNEMADELADKGARLY